MFGAKDRCLSGYAHDGGRGSAASHRNLGAAQALTQMPGPPPAAIALSPSAHRLRPGRPWPSYRPAHGLGGKVPVDAKRSFLLHSTDVTIGREARLQGPPREGPESGRKRAFALRKARRSRLETDSPLPRQTHSRRGRAPHSIHLLVAPRHASLARAFDDARTLGVEGRIIRRVDAGRVCTVKRPTVGRFARCVVV
jgi:hypothetical protein